MTVLLASSETKYSMARYSAFLGRRVEVQYRAGDILLPASGTFVADSGRSIFLEENFEQRGIEKHFRWEIPYQYIVRLEEKELPPGRQPRQSWRKRLPKMRPQAPRLPPTPPRTEHVSLPAQRLQEAARRPSCRYRIGPRPLEDRLKSGVPRSCIQLDSPIRLQSSGGTEHIFAAADYLWPRRAQEAFRDPRCHP